MQDSFRVLTLLMLPGTLVQPYFSVGAVYAKAAKEHGINVKDDEINERFFIVFGELQKNKNITIGEEKNFGEKLFNEFFNPTLQKNQSIPCSVIYGIYLQKVNTGELPKKPKKHLKNSSIEGTG